MLAALLLLGGVAIVLGFGFGGSKAKNSRAEGFDRVDVPGALTLHVDHPATYYVYSELTTCLYYPNCHGELYPVAVTVTGPTGKGLKVTSTRGPSYMIGGTEGVGVARFDATAVGNYRVAASTGPYSGGQIAVGEAFPSWTEDLVTWSVLALLWAGAGLIVIVPIARSRRT